MRILPAVIADAEGIARLVTVLGYETSHDRMRSRLESILSDDAFVTLVAWEGERIVGFVGARVGPLYERDGLCGQILALSVATESQGRGVGGTLLQAAERILIARGARDVVLTSGNHRAGAHAFYEKNGYAFTGRRYRKSVTSSD